MKGFQTKLDVIGNNIANVNTIGYKKSTINFQDLLSQNLSNSGVNPMQVGLGSQVSSMNVIHTPGSAMSTGVGTDLAIMGDGFFMVSEKNVDENDGPVPATGTKFLTRAGNFVADKDGYLVSSQGLRVLDETGKFIQIDSATYASFTIDREGKVIGKYPDGTENPNPLHTIGIANPQNPAGLLKYGGSLYELTEASGPLNQGTAADAASLVSAGMLEMSNVDLTEEFTEMIVAQRGFQANSRTLSTSDEILQEIVNLKR